jgi:FMN phosphatase YigB (HAD superfamily)
VLARLGAPDAHSVLMVGDRSHDVIGARAHGIDTIGAGWGYGLAGEFELAQPVTVCATVADLAALLESGRDMRDTRDTRDTRTESARISGGRDAEAS